MDDDEDLLKQVFDVIAWNTEPLKTQPDELRVLFVDRKNVGRRGPLRELRRDDGERNWFESPHIAQRMNVGRLPRPSADRHAERKEAVAADRIFLKNRIYLPSDIKMLADERQDEVTAELDEQRIDDAQAQLGRERAAAPGSITRRDRSGAEDHGVNGSDEELAAKGDADVRSTDGGGARAQPTRGQTERERP